MRRVCFPSGFVAVLLAAAPFIFAQEKDKPVAPQAPAETKPADKPVEKTAPAKPVPGLPDIPDPTTPPKPAPKTEPAKTTDPEKPKTTEPAPTKTDPAKTEPAKTEPSKPDPSKPTVPIGDKPAGDKPTTDKPAGDKPAPSKPTPEDARAQYMEERFQQVRGEMEDLKSAYALQLQKTSDLTSEIKALREDNRKTSARASQTYASQEDIKMLTEKLLELDRKRLADRELILAEFSKMMQKITAAAALPPPQHTTKPAPGGKGVEHRVAKGEFLSTIIVAYNTEFKKQGKKAITMQQVLDANPNLKPERVLVGQMIFIPLHDSND
ncbi:MAG: LysM peptidoglycan-binding domain-containing protein [Pedosphaera sp.]|nr:LysM peptidoglycan-binding domain-containing protein [Pedosphaera sp.]MSU42444.1 LysM peptidoglycan-binding domain-containing protein [Pedosphaera sp.]